MQDRVLTAKGVLAVLVVALAVPVGCRRDEPIASEGSSEAPTPQPAAVATPPSSTEAASTGTEESTPDTTGSAPPKASRPAFRPAVRFITPETEVIDKIASELIPLWDKIQSASLTVHSIMERSGELRFKQEGEGTIDLLRKDGKLLIRSELFSGVFYDLPEPGEHGETSIETGQRLWKYVDDPYLYTLEERAHGEMRATKTWARSQDTQFVGGRPMFDQLRRLSVAQLIGEQTMDAKNVYVLQGTRQSGKGKTTFYVDKATGLLLKLIGKNKTKRTEFTFTVTDIKLDVEFGEDHFVFTPPEGVELEDLTQRGG